MKFGPDDQMWVVVDPTPESELSDVLFESSLRKLALQFKGGLSMDANPTIFSDRQLAEYEAFGRLTAARAARAVLDAHRRCSAARVDRIELYDAEGTLVFEVDLETWKNK